jgi:hypothetical protein
MLPAVIEFGIALVILLARFSVAVKGQLRLDTSPETLLQVVTTSKLDVRRDGRRSALDVTIRSLMSTTAHTHP